MRGKNFYTRLFVIALAAGMLVMGTAGAETLPGDADGNETVALGDVITILKLLTEETVFVRSDADVNGDKRIGIAEAVYALQIVAELKQEVTEAEKTAFENRINAALLSLAKDSKTMSELEAMSAVLTHINIADLQTQIKRSSSSLADKAFDLLNTPFPCGTLGMKDVLSNVIAFNFTGNTGCGGIAGTVTVSPFISENELAFNITYDNIKVKAGESDCTISGNTLTYISEENGRIIASHTFDKMILCGQEMEGTVTMSYDAAGQLFSVSGTSQHDYAEGDFRGTVAAEFSYSLSDGFSGTASLTTDTQNYACTFDRLQTDPGCGVPTSGSLNIDGTEITFGNSSCINPLVTATLNGVAVDVDMEPVKDGIYQNRIGPRSGHTALQIVDSCTTLLDTFKQTAIEEMEKQSDENLSYAIQWGGCPWYWGSKFVEMDSNAMPIGGTVNAVSFSPPATQIQESASEFSETNTQVTGVDEADFVENDGTYIYILAHGNFQIISAWPPENAHVLSSYKIEGEPKRMFVYNSKAFIYSSLDSVVSETADYGYMPYYQNDDCTYGYDCEFTGDGKKLKITVLDISDTAEPVLIREIYFSGSYLNSRRIGDAVHSVLVFPEPEIEGIDYWPEELQNCYGGGGYWWDWEAAETRYSSEELTEMFEALKQKNRELILGSDITDWLPSVRDIRYTDGQPAEQEGLLGTCDEFYVSEQQDGKNFLSMVSTTMDGSGDLNTTTVVGKPGAVYASSSAFYIVSKHQHSPRIFWFFDEDQGIEEASTVHKFTLSNDPPSSAYKAAGAVKGRVLNQFSMDENEGFFRLATTTGQAWDKNAHSTISVLEDKGAELVLVGQIDGLAPGEDIRSARFDGNRGFIVTFKKTDPLFAFDLSDPYNPVKTGELKIPGFSTYMHRMDDSHLLTIGYDAQDEENFAWFQGIMLQVFDVSDMSNPTLLHKEVIGTRGSTSDAATDHLAFNFFKPKDLLAIPMTVCQGGDGGTYGDIMTFSGLMVYKVTTDAGFEYIGGVSHKVPETEDSYRGECSNWWTDSNSIVKRSIFMDDYVFSVTEDEIRVNSVSKLGTDIAVVSLAAP